MEVKIDESFEKDLHKLKDAQLNKRVAKVIRQTQAAENLTQVTQLKKLKGTNSLYRIRVGDYRIGLEVQENVAIFIRILHRKDIYKFFP
jgi:mRNA interferase RelE/StbE